MCLRLGVSRASYYRWLAPTHVTPTAQRHAQLVVEVSTEFYECAAMAGRDQLTKLLNQRGVRVAAGTVGSIMNECGLRARRMRAWKRTTTSDPGARTEHIRNHMLDEYGTRDFTAVVPGTRLVGDITYLKTGSGWLYLATVIDVATRMVVGWSMDSHMRTQLIINALAMARDHGRLHREGSIFHSDRGTQYTSSQFQKWCAGNKIVQSMGATGVCWDNAVAENFFSHLKTEMYHHYNFPDHLSARTAVMEYIESWYNRRRPHSNNQGMSPAMALFAYQQQYEPAA